jgi:mRNA interferase RelE/StbE
VDSCGDPQQRGKGLTANWAGLWRYRVGDHRVICQLEDDRLLVLVVRIAHRSEAYK